MADLNLDTGFVRMSWARFFALGAGIVGSCWILFHKLSNIEQRLDNSVTVKQMHRWERDLKSQNPGLIVPSISDYESASIQDGKKGVANARQ